MTILGRPQRRSIHHDLLCGTTRQQDSKLKPPHTFRCLASSSALSFSAFLRNFARRFFSFSFSFCFSFCLCSSSCTSNRVFTTLSKHAPLDSDKNKIFFMRTATRLRWGPVVSLLRRTIPDDFGQRQTSAPHPTKQRPSYTASYKTTPPRRSISLPRNHLCQWLRYSGRVPVPSLG